MSKLLDDVRNVMRVRHYSYETEKIYIYWIRQYIYFHKITHPAEMGAAQIEAFLTHLAVKKAVSASTQNQALFALLFLYREVLKINLPWLEEFTPAKKSERVPVVLTKEEVKMILDELKGTNWMIANLLYGSGLRLIEALRLRVKDLDFGYRQIVVRDGKGGNDRFTVLPTKLIEPLQKQLETVRKLHEQDLRHGLGRVEMAFCFSEKISERRNGILLAICFSVKKFERESAFGFERTTPRFACEFAKAVQRSNAEKPHRQKCQPAYASPLVRYTSFTGRLRHSHNSGTART